MEFLQKYLTIYLLGDRNASSSQTSYYKSRNAQNTQ